MSKARVIGTTIDAILAAEAELGRQLPESLSKWLLANNGKTLDSLTIFPVYDKRDPRKTWDSIARTFRGNWRSWINNFPENQKKPEELLPIAEFGTGDYYCLDYSKTGISGEPIITKWSHETGETTFIAESFSEFLKIDPESLIP